MALKSEQKFLSVSKGTETQRNNPRKNTGRAYDQILLPNAIAGNKCLPRLVHQLHMQIVPLEHAHRNLQRAFTVPIKIMVLKGNLLWLPIKRLKNHAVEAVQDLRVAHRAASNFIPEIRQGCLKAIAAIVKIKRDVQVVGENLPRKWRGDFKHDRFRILSY